MKESRGRLQDDNAFKMEWHKKNAGCLFEIEE
jgi:hypothetical protein